MAIFSNPKHTRDPLQNDLTILEHSLILDLIPSAALIYDRTNDHILSANKRFLELTAFESSVLEGFSLTDITPNKLDTNPTGNESRPIQLMNASGEQLTVNLRIQSLSPTNQIVVLNFTLPASEQDIRTELINKEILYDNLSLLVSLGAKNSLNDALTESCQILKKVLNPKDFAYYLRENKSTMYVRVPVSTDEKVSQLPITIESDFIKDLSVPSLWVSSKKTECALHELALVKGYHYLLTIPLTLADTVNGFIVAGGYAPVPDDDTLRFLQLLGSHTANTIHHLNKFDNARRTLQKVREVVQMQHAITDNLEEGIIILTADLRIAELSPSAEIMLGYASKEVFRQKAEMVLIGNETLSTMYKSAQQGISTLVGNNLSLNTRNGKTFLAQVLCIPVMSENKLSSIVLILRDLSQSEQIRARSQQLEQRAFLGEVSAIFAHEVKNPINSIMTGLQYIGMTMKPEDPHYDLITRLQNDCLRLTHLMESTLTFSKPIEYHFYSVDLAAMIPSILDRWGPRMKRLNINYHFDTNPEHPLVRADSRALEQVFVNIISNAIQAMDATGGTLNIKIAAADARLEPPQYEIIVADSGPGIPDDIKDHIFEPFVTTNASGTGLGLAISKRIVAAHKGNIFVESFPGGSMFHILLPKAD